MIQELQFIIWKIGKEGKLTSEILGEKAGGTGEKF